MWYSWWVIHRVRQSPFPIAGRTCAAASTELRAASTVSARTQAWRPYGPLRVRRSAASTATCTSLPEAGFVRLTSKAAERAAGPSRRAADSETEPGRSVAAGLAYLTCGLVPVHDRHLDVQDDDVRPEGTGHFQSLLAVIGGPCHIALHGQKHGEAVSGIDVVVNHEDSPHEGWLGSVGRHGSEKAIPMPGRRTQARTHTPSRSSYLFQPPSGWLSRSATIESTAGFQPSPKWLPSTSMFSVVRRVPA